MKIFSLIGILLSLQITTFSSSAITGEKGPAALPHPRLLLLGGEENSIRNAVASDEAWAKIHNFIINESRKMMEKPPVERVMTGRRLLGQSREALRRIFYLSYAWRMTSEEMFCERALDEMKAVALFNDWNPSHFLDVAEMTMAVSLGYDWLFEKLPDETRIALRKAIVEKGLRPSLLPENSGWTRAAHNWNQVCNAGMTFGALAVWEDEQELADSVIDRAVKTITLPMNDYEPDGAYPEGYSYWGYGTSFNVMIISALEKIFGTDSLIRINEGFMKTAAYMENMTGPTGMSFNYSDAGQGSGMNPAMFWFAGRLDDPSLLWSEKYHLETKAPPNDRLLPAVLIWASGITMDSIVPPEKKMWVGQGKNPVAMMRTSWTDHKAVFAALKAGTPSANHGHMDAGSFVLEADGQRWAMDFGMQDYNSLETAGVNLWNMAQNSQRWKVYRYNNFVHNTLTVNSKLQKVNGHSSLTSFADNPGFMYAKTDLSSLYADDLGKAHRGIAIVGNEYFMVRDEVETSDSGAMVTWNMLTSANVALVGDDIAELTLKGKKLVMRLAEPAGARFRTMTTVPPEKYDAPNPGTTLLGFEVSVPPGSKKNLVVIFLPEKAVENKSLTEITLDEWELKMDIPHEMQGVKDQ